VVEVQTVSADSGTFDLGSCVLSLTLGDQTINDYPLDSLFTDTWYPIYSLPYTTGPQETYTYLGWSLSCSGADFSNNGVVEVYFDAVHLIPGADDNVNDLPDFGFVITQDQGLGNPDGTF
jgi:hypothetical protein